MISSEPQKKVADAALDLGRFASLGLQFGLTLLLFGAVGWWLDGRLGTSPWLLVAGLVCGNVIAFFALVRAAASAKSPPHDPPQEKP